VNKNHDMHFSTTGELV